MNKSVKNALVIGSLLGLGSLVAAESRELDIPRPDIEVVVYVYDYARLPEGVLDRAQTIAGQIFRHAGIEMVWVPLPVGGEAWKKFSAFERPVGPMEVYLRILPKPHPKFARHDEVLGFTVGSLATVYYQRVDRMVFTLTGAPTGIFARHLPLQMSTSLLLGVVAAHELGHLLLGSNAHCRKGIMQPFWSRDDLEDALFGRQGFTPGQIERLRFTFEPPQRRTVVATLPPR